MRTVVGVVGDVRMRGLERTSEPQVYLPYRQVPDGALRAYIPKDLVIRSSAAPPTLMPALRAIVQAADPQQPLSTLRPLEDVVAAHTAPRRVQLYAVGAFAALACVLAGLGIYGVLSFTVARRAREIGVRLALGATSKTILMMVLREGCVLAALGTTVGLALAVVAGRLLEALLAGVKPTDPLTFGAALAIALVMTLVGSVVPALRAARLQPSAVIRAN
jgi:ABC-type antimicrobial peptide transport system permease subunit